MTITAEFVQDWSSPDTNPWTDPNFDQLNGDVKISSGGLRPTSSSGPRYITYNGEINATGTLAVSIHLAQDGYTAHDFAGPGFANPIDGTGYWLKIASTGNVYVSRVDPGGLQILGDSVFVNTNPLSTDTYKLTLAPNGFMEVWRNNVLQSSFTDATYHAGLAPAAVFSWENNNLNGIREIGIDGLGSQTLGISSVNGGTTIVSGDNINIACTLGDTVTGATLSNGTDNLALTVLEVAPLLVNCAAIDIHNTAFAPGQALTLSITDGATNPGLAVDVTQIAGNIWLVTTGIDATNGLLKDVTSPAIGDGYEGEPTANSGLSTLTYETDGPHRNYDPAVPNATPTTGWFYDASAKTWEQITETTNRIDGAVAPFWRAQPAPPSGTVGLPYSYCFGGLVEGDRPITYTLETGAYPTGLTINQTTECIVGTPTQSGQFTGMSITATNAAGAATSIVFVLDIIPLSVTNVSATAILQQTATIGATTNSGTGVLFVAIRTTSDYTQADVDLIKSGAGAEYSDSRVPITGVNTFMASGLISAREQYVGVVQESGAESALVATTNFITLAYTEGPTAPEQCVPYPELISYYGIPVHHNLLYGWCGDNPKTLAAERLPPGLSAASNGDVTGTPTIPGTTSVTANITNPNGTSSGTFSWKIYTLQSPVPDGMTRKALVDAVIAYSDRYTDTEMQANMDAMITFAEHRMSRIMRNRNMCERVKIPLVPGEEWQQLPADFDGMREVAITPEGGTKVSLEAITPQQATQREQYGAGNYYVIQANQLRLVGEHTGDIEITYYQRVPPLIEDADTNWVLEMAADIYQVAIQAQIELFAKNDERALALDAQLVQYFSEMSIRDQKDRWSGGPLSTRADT